MVYGLEKFKEFFGDYTNQYVFIGGTACHILMGELGAYFMNQKVPTALQGGEKINVKYYQYSYM